MNDMKTSVTAATICARLKTTVSWSREVVVALALLASQSAHALIVGEKDWRQVAETVNFSWYQVNTVCSNTTGSCSGSLGSVSFDGWTWASVDDVRDLFEQLILPNSIEYPTLDSSWGEFYGNTIDVLIDESMFLNTDPISSGIAEGVFGLTRSDYSNGGVDLVIRPYLQNYFLQGVGDGASLNSTAYKGASAEWMGVWLYRSTSPVPESEVYAQMLAGLGVLGVIFLRRKVVKS